MHFRQIIHSESRPVHDTSEARNKLDIPELENAVTIRDGHSVVQLVAPTMRIQ